MSDELILNLDLKSYTVHVTCRAKLTNKKSFAVAQKRAQEEELQVKYAGEQFILSLYGAGSFKTLDQQRHMYYKRTVEKSSPLQLCHLPPTSAAAKQHSFRAHLTVQGWMGNNLPSEEWGW